MTEVFETSWVRRLDESMQEWISKYIFTDWMCVGRKPHPFGNERHTIACGLLTIIWFEELVKGMYCSHEHIRPEFDEIGKTVGIMLWCIGNIWNCTKVVIMDSGFYVTKGLL